MAILVEPLLHMLEEVVLEQPRSTARGPSISESIRAKRLGRFVRKMSGEEPAQKQQLETYLEQNPDMRDWLRTQLRTNRAQLRTLLLLELELS